MRLSGQTCRFLAVTVLLLGTALYLQSHRREQVVPNYTPLQQFPSTVANWRGRDVPVESDVLRLLGPDAQVLTRIYDQGESAAYIGVYIAYFPVQRRGDTLHSPQHCLPGAGWSFLESSRIWLHASNAPTVNAGRYVIANGDSRQLVYYWYQAHGRTVPGEYMAKYYLFEDAMRLNRTDGGLVRLMTPIFPSETAASADSRLAAFAEQVIPGLPTYIPN